MKIEEIHALLDKMLGEQKSRNFLNHLVKAYVPIAKVNVVIETADPAFKCVLTKIPLVTVKTISDTLQTDEVKNTFKKELKTFVTDEGVNVSRSLGNILGESQLAVTGKNTNTAMSYDAFQTFYNWVLKKSLEGDKHINWLLGSIRRENLAKAAKVTDPKLEKKLKKSSVKQTTYTLGQTTGALANLKSKMLKEEKANG
jgi:hypothetical protein